MFAGSRVFIYASEFPPCKGSGGIGNHAYNLARMFKANKFLVQVLSESFFVKDNLYPENDSYFKVFYIKRWKGFIYTYFARLYYLIKFSRQSDLVIISGAVPIVFSLFLKILYIKKPICIVAHGTELTLGGRLKLFLTHLSLSYAQYLVAVSNYTKSFIPKSVREKVVVIPNGYYIPVEAEKKRNLNRNELVLLTVGSISYRKGQLNVIRALPEILKSHPNLVYRIVGSMGLREEIEAIATELKVKDRVVFLGKVDNEELYKSYCEADIFLMLSEHTNDGDFEGFGIAILEANHFGIPAIGSIGTGIEDAIKDGYNGKLVDPKNVTQIAVAVNEIMQEYKSYSDRAQEWALNHRWERIFPQYLRMINK